MPKEKKKAHLQKGTGASPPAVYNRCAYTSPADGWQCMEPVWPGSHHNCCIGHAQEFDKPAPLFSALIQKKVKKNDFTFDGFVFPFRIRIKNLTIQNPFSFIGCTFLDGLKMDNVRFEGPFTSFSHCVFIGSSIYFTRCHFASQKLSFAHSLFEGDILAFDRCHFVGENTDWSSMKWEGEKAIAFLRCTFGGKTHRFTSSQFIAPLFAIKGGTLSSQSVDFHKTYFKNANCSLRGLRQTKGELSFDAAQFDCETTLFSKNFFHGQKIGFAKTVWKGKEFTFGPQTEIKNSLSFDRCQLDCDSIDFTDLHAQGRFVLSNSRLRSQGDIDFSRLVSEKECSIHDCRFDSRRLILSQMQTNGDGFFFQKNHLNTYQLSCSNSIFASKRFSFNRNRIHAAETEFTQNQYKNIQTDFKAMHVEGERISFQHSRFISKRVSFNLSHFDCDSISWNDTFYENAFVSFWKTGFNSAQGSFKNASERNSQFRFSMDLSRVLFAGANLHDCDFSEAKWGRTDFTRRPAVADESELLSISRFTELQAIYRWIAEQYQRKGLKKQQNDFLYALREIERLEQAYEGHHAEQIKSELSKWVFGYGLGVSRAALLKGFASLCASLIPLFSRVR